MINTKMLYALIVFGQDVQRGTALQPLLVVNDPESSCSPTLTPFRGGFPESTTIFKTEQQARDLAQTWNGHPYWYSLNGEFKIIELEENPITDPYKERELRKDHV